MYADGLVSDLLPASRCLALISGEFFCVVEKLNIPPPLLGRLGTSRHIRLSGVNVVKVAALHYSPRSLPPVRAHSAQTTSFGLRERGRGGGEREDRPRWILPLIFNEPSGLNHPPARLFPPHTSRKQTMTRLENMPAAHRRTCPPICLRAINPPPPPHPPLSPALLMWLSVSSLGHSQQREGATPRWCGGSAEKTFGVSPAGRGGGSGGVKWTHSSVNQTASNNNWWSLVELEGKRLVSLKLNLMLKTIECE